MKTALFNYNISGNELAGAYYIKEYWDITEDKEIKWLFCDETHYYNYKFTTIYYLKGDKLGVAAIFWVNKHVTPKKRWNKSYKAYIKYYLKDLKHKIITTDTDFSLRSLLKNDNVLLNCIFHVRDNINKSKKSHNSDI